MSSKKALPSRAVAVALLCHVALGSHSPRFFPCSVSHSPRTNKATPSAAWGWAARWLRDADHHILLPVFCFFFFFFCACRHYSAHSLLNPSSRPSSSQPVTARPVLPEASQGRCVWHLLQHMVHLLLQGARRASASRSSLCVRGMSALQLPSGARTPSDALCI